MKKKMIPEIKIQEEPISYPLPKVEETNDKGPEFFKHLQVFSPNFMIPIYYVVMKKD